MKTFAISSVWFAALYIAVATASLAGEQGDASDKGRQATLESLLTKTFNSTTFRRQYDGPRDFPFEYCGVTFEKDENGTLSSHRSSDWIHSCSPFEANNLDFSFSGITAIAPRTFAGLGNGNGLQLGQLILAGNYISRLTADVFEGMGHVSNLVLIVNPLNLDDSLEEGLFKDVNPTMVSLSNCGIRRLPRGLFQGMQNAGTYMFEFHIGNYRVSNFDPRTNDAAYDNKISGEQLYDYLEGYEPRLVLTSLGLSGLGLTSLPGNMFSLMSQDWNTAMPWLWMSPEANSIWKCLPDLQPLWQRYGFGSEEKKTFVQESFNLGVDFDYSNWQQFPACPPRGYETVEPSDHQECNENRTMKEVVRGEERKGYFTGGLGSLADEQHKIWGCFSNHPCLAAVYAPIGSAACFKFNEANGTWSFWQISSDIGLSCTEGRR